MTSLEPFHAFGIVAASGSMRVAIDWIRRVAPTGFNVLLSGETGTGKELVARAIHDESPRRKAGFVQINCAAIPESLVESELFGYRRGAFTGAVEARQGLLEAADGGTVFLDEIGELPLAIQPRLLRCLDNGEVRRLGETVTRRLDVRVIAATNRDLEEEMTSGHFRRDLYFRLCVASCHLPPLRERPEDIEALVQHWLPTVSALAHAHVTGITSAAIAVLQGHTWLGNARELRHVLERAMLEATGPLLTVSDIRAALGHATPREPGAQRPPTVSRAALSPEDERLLAALEAHRWNRSATARSLGINRTTVWRALQRLLDK